jgi:hypothetical protein
VVPLTRLVFAIGVVGFAIGVAHFVRAAEGNVATDKNSSDAADQTRPGASSICTRRKLHGHNASRCNAGAPHRAQNRGGRRQLTCNRRRSSVRWYSSSTACRSRAAASSFFRASLHGTAVGGHGPRQLIVTSPTAARKS